MKALLFTLLEGVAGLALICLLVDKGPIPVALFTSMLILGEIAERERTNSVLKMQQARAEEEKRKLRAYLEVRRHEA